MSASAAFAADDVALGATDDVALSEVSDEMAIEENVLTDGDDSSLLSDDYSDQGFDVVENFGPVNVTADNFFDYFDDAGTLYDNVSTDELVFSGDFSEIGVGYITIGRSITFTGHDATFDGATFVVMADDVTIDGLTITQSSDVYAINVYGSSGIVISNNFIEYTALEGFDSYGIYATASSDLSILNNTIVYYGNTDGTVVNNAIRIEGDDENEIPFTDIVVSGNIIDITIPSADKSYDQYTYEETAISEGIVFYYVEDLEFVGNRVDVRFNDVTSTSSYDSINVISVRSDAYSFGEIQSKNILIADNNITVDGYSCVYPVYVCADNFNITGNIIVSTAENYLAHGIDVDGPSSKGIVADNDVTVEAPVAAYGIYSYQWMGAVEDITYYNNTISVAGYGSAGMEVVECNPTVLYNTITAEGNYTYGIIASCRDEGTIEGNTINALGSNIGSDATGDSLMSRNSMGISVKGASEITDNTVYSTNVGLNFVEDGETLVEGNTITVEASGLVDNYAIHAESVDDLTFIGNTINFIGYSNGTVVSNAVRIEGNDKKFIPVKNIKFEGNTFDISIPSCDVEYDWTTYEPTVYSEGIILYYVEDVEFVNNTVEVAYNDVTSASNYDSIYGVSVKGNPYIYDFDDDYGLIYPVVSKNVVIADNNISVEGHACAYAVWVGAENLTVSGNDIYSSSETYLAHGIDVDSNTVGAMVADNTIVAVAPLATYGICADGYMGPISESEFINNNVTVTGYSSIGMKVVVDSDPYIAGNTVTAEGNYTYGIIANNGVVSGNTVYALGSNTGSDPTGDSYMQKNSVGISVKATDVVDNTVYSTNTGLNIVQEGGIVVEDNIITVENNGLIDSYGIYSNVGDLAFTDNTINYVGYSNGTVVNNAVRIEGNDKKFIPVKNIKFEGNTFDISIPSCDVEYDWTTYEPTVYSEGIILYYVEDVEFVNNTVEVRYNNITSAWGYDSIYGVSVKGNPYIYDFDDDYGLIYPVVSKNVVIADNNITVRGHACAYAVWVGAENLTVAGNDIFASSLTYLAHGIDVDSNTVGAMVADNTIVAVAPLATYGICADGYMGPISESEFINNNVSVVGYSSIGMKVVVDSDPYIAGNTVTAEGNYTYGIIANNGVVSGNTVHALGSNTGSDPTGDSYMQKNSVGISVKATDVVDNTVYSTNVGLNIVKGGGMAVCGNNITVVSTGDVVSDAAIIANGVDVLNITDNNVTTDTDYTVVITNSTGVVYDNYLQAAELRGSSSVLTDGNVDVYNNLPASDTILTADSIVAVYNDGSKLIATLTDVGGNVISNAKLKFAVSGKSAKYIRTDANGQAALSLANYDIGTYRATITYVATDYYNKCSATAKITIVDVMPTSFDVDDLNTEYNSGESLVANLTDANGNPLVNKSVIVDFNGTLFGLVTDENGQIAISTDGLDAGNYSVAMAFIDDDGYYNNASAEVNIVITAIDTIVTASDVNTTYGLADYLVATLTDANGNPIADAKLKFAVSGKSAKYIRTDANGQAALNIANYDIGTYRATITYVATQSYNKASTTAKIIISPKKESAFVVSDLETSYNSGDNLTATLVDENGDALVNKTVIVAVDGVIFDCVTDENGQVSVSTDGFVPGSYGTSFAFAGDDTCIGSNATANIFVDKMDTVLSAPDVVAVYKDGSKLIATLTDANGNVISDAKLKFAVSGKTTKYIRTDANGQAALDLSNYDVGKYWVSITFVETDLYNKASTNAKIIINEA